VATIERLTAADHTAVGLLLLVAYADCSEHIGADWSRLRDGLVHAAGRACWAWRWQRAVAACRAS
jgi:hypothetical protein